MVLIIFVTLFSWEFCLLQIAAIVFYIIITYWLTEYRAKGFKSASVADQNYNQRATDSLLNFETVKYFNAEKHEEKRFETALSIYKNENIKLSKSLVYLNISQSVVICIGLCCTLVLANHFIELGKLTVEIGRAHV